jgi:hypothetical protein
MVTHSALIYKLCDVTSPADAVEATHALSKSNDLQ